MSRRWGNRDLGCAPLRDRPPLESLKLRDHCEMCGSGTLLEPGFNPSGIAQTLCQLCRIGSAELLHERARKAREFVELVSRMKTETEYGDGAPPSEDWISTMSELIESARKIRRPL